jgi:methanogenic corrinoid protein MtbC1
VAACVPGNIHDIGLRALADIFQLEGWRSIYLGADVPKSDLPAMLDVFEADLLLLGSTLSTHIEPAAQAIAIVREQVDRPVKIMVGGAAFDELPELWEKLGADAYAADADQALAAAAAMLKT